MILDARGNLAESLRAVSGPAVSAPGRGTGRV